MVGRKSANSDFLHRYDMLAFRRNQVLSPSPRSRESSDADLIQNLSFSPFESSKMKKKMKKVKLQIRIKYCEKTMRAGGLVSKPWFL